jgi:hypothetical protein
VASDPCQDRLCGDAVPDVGRRRQDARFRQAGNAKLEISATLEHEGSGYAVTKARITSAGKTRRRLPAQAQDSAFDQVPLAGIVRNRAEEVGLLTAMANAAGEPQ